MFAQHLREELREGERTVPCLRLRGILQVEPAESADAPKFWLSQATGHKRSIRQAEWVALRGSEKAGGPKLVVVIMTKANLAAIPGN